MQKYLQQFSTSIAFMGMTLATLVIVTLLYTYPFDVIAGFSLLNAIDWLQNQWHNLPQSVLQAWWGIWPQGWFESWLNAWTEHIRSGIFQYLIDINILLVTAILPIIVSLLIRSKILAFVISFLILVFWWFDFHDTYSPCNGGCIVDAAILVIPLNVAFVLAILIPVIFFIKKSTLQSPYVHIRNIVIVSCIYFICLNASMLLMTIDPNTYMPPEQYTSHSRDSWVPTIRIAEIYNKTLLSAHPSDPSLCTKIKDAIKCQINRLYKNEHLTLQDFDRVYQSLLPLYNEKFPLDKKDFTRIYLERMSWEIQEAYKQYPLLIEKHPTIITWEIDLRSNYAAWSWTDGFNNLTKLVSLDPYLYINKAYTTISKDRLLVLSDPDWGKEPWDYGHYGVVIYKNSTEDIFIVKDMFIYGDNRGSYKEYSIAFNANYWLSQNKVKDFEKNMDEALSFLGDYISRK